ncbi:MAG: hypothetical protein K2M44_05280 [Clostridia bacterium]|nr:hypothetical protein [Clostridia bacterium]
MDVTEFEIGGVKLFSCIGDNSRDKVISAALGGGRVEHLGSGAPYAVDADGRRIDCHISITHTDKLCVIAVSDTPVGIDAERLERRVPDSIGDIYRWTDTEAYVKCMGRGLRLDDVRRGGYKVDAYRKRLYGEYALSVYKS